MRPAQGMGMEGAALE